AGCLCNDAQLQHADVGNIDPQDPQIEPTSATAVGEPTESALVEVAAKFGLVQFDLQNSFPRIGEIAFDSERKRMATRHSIERADKEIFGSVPDQVWSFEQAVFVKGAVESILEESSFVWVGNEAQPLEQHWLAQIEESRNEMASQGTRVLAFGFRRVAPGESDEDLESEIVFVGMIGLTDPPRPEAKTAVARCRQAGIRPVMITGDHPLTALSIARQLGISDGETAVTGQELARMPKEDLRQRVDQVEVYARVAPADKLNIVEALQHNREVVAMTGDGVNDAPALKQANVGVAMGVSGTDVSIQAADVVLLDDNFATIVAAVEQGRIVYDNVRKFVKYTMSSNAGEVMVMTIGILLGMPLPLLPLQVLWVNLVTDGLPGLALAIEPVEKNTMNRAPYSPDEPVFNRRMTTDVMWIGLMIGILSLVAGNLLADSEEDVGHWRTVIFTVLTFSQMGNAIACRSDQPLLFNKQQTNLSLWGAIATTALLQLAVIYVPFLQNVFGTKSLSIGQLALSVGSGVLVFVAVEIQKRLFFR
ncbi:HAD-IC family P-type ATPase, partial [Saprospiraceae bacterium]|nr:HAD-IC family P-type ATPase [Saprospiraceae bacterium]